MTSVRAIVFQNEQVLVFEERNGQPYTMPGGRVESGETIMEALHR